MYGTSFYAEPSETEIVNVPGFTGGEALGAYGAESSAAGAFAAEIGTRAAGVASIYDQNAGYLPIWKP